MDWVPLGSSNLSAAKYEESTRVLTVQFQNGREYEYYGVEQQVFDDLITAPSKGRYFNQAIRKRYRFSEA